ncbi:hypothetical protein Nepgr_008464 [Nepenthes gracilis]|uniref:Uncharacterized protein n=1 Tax=Nepenthes gracilis TaxID=150966 RepID=A0AAD3S9C0_NEPGR|nr:hypothetical protein Nepgr_008464 [Nepenthes gracilis]
MSYNYKKVSARCHGFRLNRRRFSIQRLRAKKWRSSYRLLKNGIATGSRRICSSRNRIKTRKSSSMISLSNAERPSNCRLRSLGRTNSFYSEAIEDCLDFIKRSTLSGDRPSLD